MKKTVYFSISILMALILAGTFIPTEAVAKDKESSKKKKAKDDDAVSYEDYIASTTDASQAVSTSGQYTLGVDDVIEIKVTRHPEVSGQYRINKDGKIQYEFVGDIFIAGQTKEQVTETIRGKISEYIISPDVQVKISGFNSKVVYVIGEVGRPGKIAMRGDTMTVRDALVQAGLPTLSSKAAKSVLITPTADGKPVQKRVNVHDLLFEGDLRENLVMKPGDTLYVPPTAMAKAMRVIQPVTAPITTAAGGARTVMSPF